MATREVHPNWERLMEFCQSASHGELTLTFADGVPVFAKTVQVQMRFGPVHGSPRPVQAEHQEMDRRPDRAQRPVGR